MASKTAHDVRNLIVCSYCNQVVDKKNAIKKLHPKCFYEAHNESWTSVLALDLEDKLKFRISDLPMGLIQKILECNYEKNLQKYIDSDKKRRPAQKINDAKLKRLWPTPIGDKMLASRMGHGIGALRRRASTIGLPSSRRAIWNNA